ncbi:hypothetical protein [Streptomyces olivaceiscleroticus]
MVGFALQVLGVPLGLAAGVVVFFVVLPTPVWLRWLLLVVHLAAAIYGVFFQQVPRIKRSFRLRRILRTYPWQVFEKGLPYSFGRRHSVHGEGPRFKVPDPDDPKTSVTVRLDVNRRTRWWTERMSSKAGDEAKAEIRTLWFVGDPRFRGILAVPGKRGPQRMLELPAEGSRYLAGASPEALIRAGKAGVRLPELAIPVRESGRTAVVPAPAPPPGPAWEFPATRRAMRLRLFRGAALLAVSPVPFGWLLSLGPWHASSAKGLVLVLAITVFPALKRFRTSLAVHRKMRSRATPWRTMDVEIRHRGRALVLVTGNEALRTQFALRRPPAGRAQVWYVGDIYGEGVVSLRGDGGVMPVRCTEHGRPTAKPKVARNEASPRTRRWGPIGR